ncbi:MAG: hypothetical protein MZU97_10360 [Bacillus subtilis]|nr:hypothetical protein [Bacillus subtilis]
MTQEVSDVRHHRRRQHLVIHMAIYGVAYGALRCLWHGHGSQRRAFEHLGVRRGFDLQLLRERDLHVQAGAGRTSLQFTASSWRCFWPDGALPQCSPIGFDYRSSEERSASTTTPSSGANLIAAVPGVRHLDSDRVLRARMGVSEIDRQTGRLTRKV